MGLRLMSALGLAVFIALAWCMSENRRKIDWRLVVWAIALQFAVGVVMLHTPLERYVFAGMRAAVDLLTASTLEGARFVFGSLTQPVTFAKDAVPGSEGEFTINALFAFQVLPVIIFVSAISAILHHLRIIEFVVRGIAWAMRRTLRTSGAETFTAGLLIFMGIESVTAIRGYLSHLTRSELLTVMTTFMATIAGSVMVVYSTFGAEPGHLLTASLMSAPAAILIAKIMAPETGEPDTRTGKSMVYRVETHNIFDAATRGTADGLNIALHVGAMVMVFIGLVYLLNTTLAAVSGYTFMDVMGFLFWPFAWLMGVPTSDVTALAKLLGTKTVLNEFIAYLDLRTAIAEHTLSPRTVTIATYALCGFANPGSVGIMIAGLSALVPERRAEVTQLSLRALVGGTLACFITACVAGVLIAE